MKIKLILVSLSMLLLLSACGGGEEDSGESPGPDPVSYDIDPEYYGEWLQINNSASIVLDEESKGTLTVSEADLDIIHFQYRNKTTTATYIRKWPRNSSLIGSIYELGSEEYSSQNFRSMRSAGLGGVASIEVSLQNLFGEDEGGETNENPPVVVETDEDGRYKIEDLPPSTYLLEAENSQGESVSDVIEVPAGENEIGVHTLVEGDGYNFKTTFSRTERSGADKARFVTPLVADYIAYSGTFTIENIGQEVAEGVNVSFDFSDERIASAKVKNATVEDDSQTLIINTIDPGSSKAVTIENLRFKPIDEDKITIRIPVTIRGANGGVWNDYAALTVYKRLVNINLKNSQTIGGKILIPGFAPIPIAETTARSSYSRNYKVPYIPGETYYAVIYGNSDKEPVYSLGVDVDAPSLEGFTDTSANEPDNTKEQATVLTLGDDLIAYQSKGNFDFIRIDIPEELPENSEGISFVEVGGFRDAVGNGDNTFSTGETVRYDLSVRNDGSSEIYLSSMSLSTEDEYLSLDESRDSRSYGTGGLRLRGGVPMTLSGEDEIGSGSYLSTSSSYFTATFAKGTPVNHEAEVVATLYDDWGNQWEIPFTIKAEPSKANIEVSEVSSFRVPGNASKIDEELNPGDSLLFNVAITNSGSYRTLDVITYVSSSDPNVTFLGRHNESYRSYLDLYVGDVTDLIDRSGSSIFSVDDRYPHYLLRIDVASDAPAGHEIPIIVTFTDRFGSTWTDEITFTVAE